MQDLEHGRLKVVLIEDSTLDTRLIEMGLLESSVRCQLIAFNDAEKAMNYLRENAKVGLRPDLMILDLHLGGKDGWEVLRECKNNPGLKAIPISVFTSASESTESNGCYALGACCVLRKPLETEPFIWAVQSLVSLVRH